MFHQELLLRNKEPVFPDSGCRSVPFATIIIQIFDVFKGIAGLGTVALTMRPKNSKLAHIASDVPSG
jgi:hypothetical protein